MGRSQEIIACQLNYWHCDKIGRYNSTDVLARITIVKQVWNQITLFDISR